MSKSVEETLRAAIRTRAESESLHAIAQGSGVNHASIYRFLNGERGLKIENVAKICEYLGLTLVAEDQLGSLTKRPARKKKSP